MLEQEVQEKYIILGKLKKEIDELDILKSQIVRDINVPMAEARAKAEAIITEAQNKAQAILDSAKKIKVEANDYAVKTKNEATEFLQMSKRSMQESDDALAKLNQERMDFDSYKIATESGIQQKKTEANELLSQAIALKKEVDEANINFATRKATLDRQEADVLAKQTDNKANEGLYKQKLDKLLKDLAELDKEKTGLESYKAEIQVMLDDINIKTEVVKREKEANKKLAEELAIKEKDNQDRTNSLNQQFKVLEDMNKQINEKQLTIDANQKLLDIRTREVEAKIKTLQELRAKEK